MAELTTFNDLMKACAQNGKNISEIAVAKECALSETTPEIVRERVLKIINTMRKTVKTGLKSTELSASGQCGDDCAKLQEAYKRRVPLFGKMFEKITTYALASIEENARMGIITACPTAGSCAIVPAVLIAVSEEQNIDDDKIIDALITAGLVGEIIAAKVAPAGAAAGCQAECGTAAAMAAAALVTFENGTPRQTVHAAALALKNILGLTCDPVAGLVEIPCVKRNVFMAIHAVTAAELALAGIESKIPPDEVLDAMAQTGKLMSPMLKESSEAGLAKTATALKIEELMS